jgi:hypothetical protein
MAELAELRPQASQGSPRDRLRAAITAINEELTRLHGLEDGQQRAQDQLNNATQLLVVCNG